MCVGCGESVVCVAGQSILMLAILSLIADHPVALPGMILCFVTDVDCQVHGRVSRPAADDILSEIGVRIGTSKSWYGTFAQICESATDKIIVGVHSRNKMTAKLHDEEISLDLTVKLAGGSLRRHRQKLTIKLQSYFFKIGLTPQSGSSRQLLVRSLPTDVPRKPPQGSRSPQCICRIRRAQPPALFRSN